MSKQAPESKRYLSSQFTKIQNISFYLNSYNGLFIKCGQHVGGNLTFLILRQNIQNIFDEFHWSMGQEEPPLVLLESSLDNVLQQ